MKISRPCYDKMHRCPGWAGGGFYYAKKSRCDNGHLPYDIYDKVLWKWQFNRCTTCNLLILPYMTRWLDYTWWKWIITR